MLITSISFDVTPNKRAEFVSAASRIVQTLRWSSGCLGCRLLSDCDFAALRDKHAAQETDDAVSAEWQKA